MSEQITIALIGFAGVALGVAGGIYNERQKTKAHKKSIEKGHVLSVAGMRSQVRIKHALNELRAMGIDRVLLLRVTNGGNIPRPGSNIYASALDVTTWSLDLEREILGRYKSVKVDAKYIEMCAQLAETPELAYKINVPENPTSLLEGWYQVEKVVQSWVYGIHINSFKDDNREKFEQYILSIAMRDTGTERAANRLEDLNAQEIERIINNIRAEFKKFYT